MGSEGLVRERPILFSSSMVRAILEGRKGQTRRVVKGIDQECDGLVSNGCGSAWGMLWNKSGVPEKALVEWASIRCPYGKPGDRLWVKEAFLLDERNSKGKAPQEVIYDATPEWALNYEGKLQRLRYITGDLVPPNDARRSIDTNKFWHKKPSIFMPRWASRITLEITDVRVERLNDISEADARAEGCVLSERCEKCGSDDWPEFHRGYRDAYRCLWGSINGEGSWSKNDWVWVVSFRRLTPESAEASR